MKHISPIIALSCISFTCVSLAQTTTSAKLATEIISLESLNRQWLMAYKTKDLKALDSILSDDFVSVRADGLTSTKAELLKTVARTDRFVSDVTWSNLKINVWGNTAMVTARSNVSGSDKGEPFSISNEYADFYVRSKAGWRAVGAHVIRVFEPTGAKKP
jgi:ketosteroid isomerase-like protein